MSPCTAFKKARDAIRAFGVADGLLYGTDRVFRAVFMSRARVFKYYFVAQPVAERPWLPPGRPVGVSVRAVCSGDVELRKFPRPAEVIRARFEQGGNCLAAYKGDMFLGFIWFNLGLYREDEVRCSFLPLPRGEASWDYDVYVDSRYRMGRLFARLWDELNSRLRSDDIRWTVSRISAFNAESRKSHDRLGAVVIGSAVFLRLGPLQLYVGTSKPYVHISANGEGPLISLDTSRLVPPKNQGRQ